MEEDVRLIRQITLRILAAFAASGLGVVGAGSIPGVPLWKATLMAGIGGVAFVVEGLANAYMDDGKLTAAEINEVFNGPKAKKETQMEKDIARQRRYLV